MNDADERRCVRCGRRLHFAAPQPAPDRYPLTTSTAPALRALPGGQPLAARSQEERIAQPIQRGLFPPGETPFSPKVVPIPTLTPLRPRESGPQRRGSARGASGGNSRRTPDSQRRLEFYESSGGLLSGGFASGNPPLATQVEVIFCDAPVALPTHRLLAAAVDAGIVLVGIGLFLAVFLLSGGEMSLTKSSIPIFAAALALVTLFYRLLWSVANTDTPGMRFAGLRLVDFDGRKPGLEQRRLRQIASVLSLLSAGLGIVWALVDEESLTWHDHISKTFPTPAA